MGQPKLRERRKRTIVTELMGDGSPGAADPMSTFSMLLNSFSYLILTYSHRDPERLQDLPRETQLLHVSVGTQT